MNFGPLIFLGVFLTFAISWAGLILAPQLQLGRLQPAPTDAGLYPQGRPGLAERGEAVYRANGCASCHTRHVRGTHVDVPQWGIRAGVARDYVHDYPVMLGALRLGPDLANVGVRLPSAEWHLLHLYNPKITVKNSTMPPYRFLFRKQRIEREPSPYALKLEGEFAPEPGYEIVPTLDAQALVEYLLSQRANVGLEEMPLPEEPKPKQPRDGAPDAAEQSVQTDAASGTNVVQ